jgi:hypothetical protein
LRELLKEKEQEVAQLKCKVLLLQAQMKTIVQKNKALVAAALQLTPVGMSGTSTSCNKVFKNQIVVCINNVLSFLVPLMEFEADSAIGCTSSMEY